ncbi:hypothetical protein LguiB_014686 [Lonicera macranthoides]
MVRPCKSVTIGVIGTGDGIEIVVMVEEKEEEVVLVVPLSKTLFLTFHPPSGRGRRPVPFIVRALSSLTPETADTKDDKVSLSLSSAALVKKAQWKAAIDFKWIRENKVAVEENIKNRNSRANLGLVLQLDKRVLNLQKEVERLRAERNVVASKMKGKVEPSERQKLIEEGKNLKNELLTLKEKLLKLTDKLHQEAQRIPNMTRPNVPIGGEELSKKIKKVGNPPEFKFLIKDHLKLGEELDLFDFDSAAKVSGSKFCYFKNEAVTLDTGLINWAMSEVSKRGFTRLKTPDIVRSSVVEKCGFQPRGANTQVYSIEGSDQCLVGTAEIAVAGYHMDDLCAESSLPFKYVAVSTCYRTEAGAAGTASRGLYRLHQFSKVEMFILCRPEDSESFHKELIGIEEDLFSSLGLHFITLDMASQDLGTPAYRKFDVEAWMPGLGRYGEISSASNCTDYQSRRLGIGTAQIQQQINLKRTALCQMVVPSRGNNQIAHTKHLIFCAAPRSFICSTTSERFGSGLLPPPLSPLPGGNLRIRCNA